MRGRQPSILGVKAIGDKQMISKSIQLNGHSCQTDSEQEENGWIVYITSLDRKTSSTGHGDTEETAFEDAKANFPQSGSQ